MPNPEIDLVAFSFLKNTLYLIEVKSYFNSHGVIYNDVAQKTSWDKYKILTDPKLQKIVNERLKSIYIESGLCNVNTEIKYGLIAGKIRKQERNKFIEYFSKKEWLFWGPQELKEKLKKVSNGDYRDNPIFAVAKILFQQ